MVMTFTTSVEESGVWRDSWDTEAGVLETKGHAPAMKKANAARAMAAGSTHAQPRHRRRKPAQALGFLPSPRGGAASNTPRGRSFSAVS